MDRRQSRRARAAIAAVAIVGICQASASARADEGEAPTGKLVAAGLAMAVPTYWLGVVTHEGSHALAGKLLGAEVRQFSILPGRYGKDKTFYFGYVSVSGLRTTSQRSFFWLAPKIADLVLLSGYSALTLTGNLPSNRYGALALTVLASGWVIDLGKDVVSTRLGNDVVKTYNANGFRGELSRLPWRLLHATLTLAAGYAVFRGYAEVLEDRGVEATLIPLWSAVH